MRIEIRRFYDDWQQEEEGNVPDSVLEGTGWLWEMFLSITDWAWESQALPYLWCHKSPGAESHAHLHPLNVNNPQESDKITSIFQ